MVHRLVHNFAVCALLLAVSLAGMLGGNVLCISDGHLAIEPPHQQVPPGFATAPVSTDQEPGGHHAPCKDLGVDVEAAVLQAAPGTHDPVLLALGPALTASSASAPASLYAAGADPPLLRDRPDAALSCLRCVVLLI